MKGYEIPEHPCQYHPQGSRILGRPMKR